MQIMYGLAGERRLTEWELPWLPGYEGAQPVRIGNARARTAAARRLRRGDGRAVPGARAAAWLERCHGWALQRALLDHLETVWQRARRGHLGGARRRARHFTHSKVMAWVAFDRAVKSVETLRARRPGRALARSCATQIHDDVCAHGFDAAREQLRRSPTARSELDASLLLMPLVGFLPPDDPRVRRHGRGDRARAAARRPGRCATTRGRRSTVCRRARARSSPAASGSPTPTSCSAAGTRRGALFERLLALRNDVGLLAEEYDPRAAAHARQLPAGVLARRAGQHRHQPDPCRRSRPTARRARHGRRTQRGLSRAAL